MTANPDRVLLIDDDEAFLNVMQRGFTRRGFDTETCSDPERAIDTCQQFSPSHIVLDLNMPTTSGLLLVPDLLSAAPSSRLVILTGYSSIATAVAATQAGATNYLCKPASIDEILTAFDNAAEAAPEIPSEPISVERMEWEHIQRVLAENNQNISATARALGMHRRTLQRKLQKRPVKR